MITLPIDDAAQQMSQLVQQLTQGNGNQAASLTEEGRPILAVMPWDMYETWLRNASIPSDTRELLRAPLDLRHRAMSLAAERAEALYREPELLSFEAYGPDDFYDHP